MNKLFLGLSLLTAVSFTTISCDDDDKAITLNELPATSSTFLEAYFPTHDILRVEKEGRGYSVDLSGNIEVDFNQNGDWVEVDGRFNTEIPTGFILNPIKAYVAEQYPTNKFSSIEKIAQGFEVELSQNDIDLIFDQEGKFIRIDN